MMAEANLFPDSMKVEPALRLTKSFYPSFDMDCALAVAKRFELPLKKKVKSLSNRLREHLPPHAGPRGEHTPYVIYDEPVLGLDAQHRDPLLPPADGARAPRRSRPVILSHAPSSRRPRAS